MTDFSFRSELLKKNSSSCKNFIEKKLTSSNLITILRDLIFLSVSVKVHNNEKIHPVIIVNIIKNLIGDNREKPSKTLLTFCVNYLLQFDLRSNDKKILKSAIKDGIGKTAFIGDLEDAYQESTWGEAQKLTAIFFLSSDNSRGTFDALAEIALQDIKKNGLFIFHIIRAYNFQETKDDNWVFTTSLMLHLIGNKLPEPHNNTGISPKIIKDEILLNGDIALFSAMERLWDCDYVRIKGYQREISYWCSQEVINSFYNIKLKPSSWIFKTGKNRFIEHTEDLVHCTNKDDFQIKNSLILIESFRALLKTLNSKQLLTLKKRFNDLK